MRPLLNGRPGSPRRALSLSSTRADLTGPSHTASDFAGFLFLPRAIYSPRSSVQASQQYSKRNAVLPTLFRESIPSPHSEAPPSEARQLPTEIQRGYKYIIYVYLTPEHIDKQGDTHTHIPHIRHTAENSRLSLFLSHFVYIKVLTNFVYIITNITVLGLVLLFISA